MSDKTRDCEHGQLKRSCEICELKKENAELRAVIKKCIKRLSTVEHGWDDITYVAFCLEVAAEIEVDGEPLKESKAKKGE